MDPRLAGGEGNTVAKVSQSAESRDCDGNGDIFYSDVKIPQQHGKSPEDLRHRIPIVGTSSESHDDKSSVESPGSSPNPANYGTNAGHGEVMNKVFDVPRPSLISSSANGQGMVVDRFAIEGDRCFAGTSLAAERTNVPSSTLGQGTSDTKSGDRAFLYPSQVTSTKVSRTRHTSKDGEEQTLEKQLRAFVSQKLAATGNLDQAGMCALQALSKMTSSTRSSSPTTAPNGGTSSSKVRAPPPGLEDVRKFNGEDPSSLTRVLKHYSGCVRAALRRPGITSDQVNRALVRDVGFVLEGPALEFYNLMMDGKVDWHAVAPPLACEFGIVEKSRIPMKWREVCDALHDKFLPGESISRTSLSLLSLRQSSDETIARYAERQVSINQRLSWLVERHGGITVWEALQIGLFERGLPAELSHAQHAEPACVTFQECVDRAARNELILTSRSVVEGMTPEDSTNVPARDDAQEMPILKPQMQAKSSDDDATGQATGQVASRTRNEHLPLQGHGQTQVPPGPAAGSLSTEKRVVKTAPLAEGEEGRQTQQTSGANKAAIDPPWTTRAKNLLDDSEAERPKDPRQQQRSLSNTGAVEDESTSTRSTCFTESSSERAIKQVSEMDATTPVDRKRRRGEEDDSRLRSPRRPNKSYSFDHDNSCKIPGCNQPTSHPTLHCFHHPEFGPENKARFRERRRSLAQRRHQREIGDMMNNNMCGMSGGYESFLRQ